MTRSRTITLGLGLFAVVVASMVPWSPDLGAAVGSSPLHLVDAVPSEGAELAVQLVPDQWAPAPGAVVAWTVTVENRALSAADAQDPKVSLTAVDGMKFDSIPPASLPAGWNIVSLDPGNATVSRPGMGALPVGESVQFVVMAIVTGAEGDEAVVSGSVGASNQWSASPRPGAVLEQRLRIGGSEVNGSVVASAGGAPLRDVCVVATDPSGSPSWRTVTRPDGAWNLSLPSGQRASYRFDPACQANGGSGRTTEYATSWYPAAASPDGASVITAATDGPTSLGVASLVAGGAVTGNVSVPAGANVTRVVVNLEDADTGAWVAAASPAPDGGWMAHGIPADDYRVSFVDDDGHLATRYFDGVGDRDDASTVTVAAGSATTGIDAVLSTGAMISGIVTDEVSGAPIPNISVVARDMDGDWVAGAVTAPDGSYTLDTLSPQDYTIRFEDDARHYVWEFHDGHLGWSEVTPLTVHDGDALVLDVGLEYGLTVTGRVTAAAAAHGLAVGDPIVDVLVVASVGPIDFEHQPAAIAVTDAAGNYTLTGVPRADLHLLFLHGAHDNQEFITAEWAAQFWPAQPTPFTDTTLDLRAATGPVSGIDAQLLAAPVLRGRVIDANGGRLADAMGLGPVAVAIFFPGDPEPFNVTMTHADGTFEFSSPFGGVDIYLGAVDIDDVYAGAYPPMWFGGELIDVSDWSSLDPVGDGATPLRLTAGANLTDLLVVHEPPTPPGAPTSITITPGPGSLGISWMPGAGVVDAYSVLVDDEVVATLGTDRPPIGALGVGAIGVGALQAVGPLSTDHVITGLVPGRQYRVRVVAKNLGGTAVSAVTLGVPAASASQPIPITLPSSDPVATDTSATAPAASPESSDQVSSLARTGTETGSRLVIACGLVLLGVALRSRTRCRSVLPGAHRGGRR